ncbi:MAG: RND transporter, partial [Desulfosarcina sp.]
MNSHPKAFRRWLELAMTLLLLTGCAVGPDFTEPVVKTPTAYRTPVMPGEAISDLKWWELFDDPMLFSLVTTALENNRDVQI